MLTGHDTKYFSPGNQSSVQTFKVNGIEIGVLICYDSAFPEMFNYYYKHNVKILLLSTYNAKNKGKSFIDEVTPAIIRSRAMDNEMWILSNNSSAPYSNWPTCIASPDGIIKEKLSKHKAGILYHEFPDEDYKKWRNKSTTNSI
jgi:predicted amidohydrolase